MTPVAGQTLFGYVSRGVSIIVRRVKLRGSCSRDAKSGFESCDGGCSRQLREAKSKANN